MPATAGRVRMPHNNRVSSSSALKMTGIWTNTIGYDPYAADNGDGSAKTATETDNAYEQAQGLIALAKLTNQGVTEKRGACKKCGMVGHLTFQCRNHLQLGMLEADANGNNDDELSSDDDISSVSVTDSEPDLKPKLPSKRGRGFDEEKSSKRKRSRSHSEDRKKRKKHKSSKTKEKDRKKKSKKKKSSKR